MSTVYHLFCVACHRKNLTERDQYINISHNESETRLRSNDWDSLERLKAVRIFGTRFVFIAADCVQAISHLTFPNAIIVEQLYTKYPQCIGSSLYLLPFARPVLLLRRPCIIRMNQTLPCRFFSMLTRKVDWTRRMGADFVDVLGFWN